MEAVILAGGRAERLWPITRNRAKPLLPVAGRPLMDYAVEKLLSSSSVENVIVSTSKRVEEEFRAWASGSGYENLEIYVEGGGKDVRLGAVGAVKVLVDEGRLRDECLILAGDNLFSFDVDDLVGYYRKVKASVVATYCSPNLSLVSRYNTVSLDGDSRITNFVEKPQKPMSNLVATACYAFPYSTLERVQEYAEGGGRLDILGHFLEWLHRREDVFAFQFTEYWFDIGDPDSYLNANKLMMDRRGSVIPDTARIEEGVAIVDPIVVSDGVRVTGRSRIGPYVELERGAHVSNSTVNLSVVLENGRIWDSLVKQSILGENCEIHGSSLSESLIGPHTIVMGS
ncbi:MAG: sugar phosphate nucleotidyltransferase [Candidatus Bathyarchaeia archaeon]